MGFHYSGTVSHVKSPPSFFSKDVSGTERLSMKLTLGPAALEEYPHKSAPLQVVYQNILATAYMYTMFLWKQQENEYLAYTASGPVSVCQTNTPGLLS